MASTACGAASTFPPNLELNLTRHAIEFRPYAEVARTGWAQAWPARAGAVAARGVADLAVLRARRRIRVGHASTDRGQPHRESRLCARGGQDRCAALRAR